MDDHLLSILHDHARGAVKVRSSRHAAAVTVKGNILSLGQNRMKTHPMMFRFSQNHNKVYLHAEIDAIVRCINRYGVDVLRDATLSVVRIGSAGDITNSQPCEHCQKAIEAFGLKAEWT